MWTVARIGRSSGYKMSSLASLDEGDTLCIGNKEIEVMGTLSEVEFKTGKCFSASSAAVTSSPARPTPTANHGTMYMYMYAYSTYNLYIHPH